MCEINISTAVYLSLEQARIYMTWLSENPVLKHIKEGNIKGRLVGGKWVILRQSIDDYINVDRRQSG